ncbi:MAG: hypothetical protein KIS87_12925 [Phycisphaeraceae bacterium]|nr:hypothetical protein [Phycisphaeraceae bacterium]
MAKRPPTRTTPREAPPRLTIGEDGHLQERGETPRHGGARRVASAGATPEEPGVFDRMVVGAAVEAARAIRTSGKVTRGQVEALLALADAAERMVGLLAYTAGAMEAMRADHQAGIEGIDRLLALLGGEGERTTETVGG